MVIEARVIRNADSGLPKIVEAMKFAINNESTVRISPVASSNINPETIILRKSPILFAALYWAQYFIMAEPTPQS